jgi:pyruvate/2-oxoglutarate dehydrogenase complex dihydrolipoamide dehydrogenase (E3) component
MGESIQFLQHESLEPLDEHNRRLLEQVRPAGWRNPQPAALYDLVVIGGGTAGLVCAVGAAGLGARVALVERALLGGDCLNTGCVPSKALLRSARAVHEARHAVRLGVRATTDVDFGAVMARMRATRADIAPHDSAARLASHGVDVFLGDGRFTGRRAVEVGGATLRFRRAVVATGSRPTVPDFLTGTSFLTSETIFSLTEQPRHLLVMGGGAIGCELAQAFALLGSAVTLVESAPRVLPHEDPDASAIVAKQLQQDGVTVVAKGDAAAVARAAHADAVLVAMGRMPNVDGLDLEAAGVASNKDGVHVDDRLRTSNPRIYASGDVCSPFRFTHAADAMSRIVIQNALFFGRTRASALVIPWCTYTFPEVAHVGVAADTAAERGAQRITIALGEVDRSVVDDEIDGFVRIHHQRGTAVAATIVAPHAGELIGYVADVMRRRGRIADFSGAIFPYPTVAEALRKAGDAYRRQAVTPRVRSALRRYFAIMRR